jgi:1-acyl-sn-glycerol-3-phosphate acyltransferase
MLYQLLRMVARPLARLFWLKGVTGGDHVPPTGGVIIAANHASYLDFFLIGVACPRSICWIAKETHFRKRSWSWFMRCCGQIELDRRQQVHLGTIRTALDVLRRGRVVGVFPGGSRTVDGGIGTLFPGVGLLASHSGCPVVPTAVRGTAKVFSRADKFPRAGRICTVDFGSPILPQRGENPRALTVEIQTRLLRLLPTLGVSQMTL